MLLLLLLLRLPCLMLTELLEAKRLERPVALAPETAEQQQRRRRQRQRQRQQQQQRGPVVEGNRHEQSARVADQYI